MNGKSLMSTMKQNGIAGLRRRQMLLASAGLGLQAVLSPAVSQAAAAMPGPLRQPAGMTARAARGMLTRVVRAGDRLVAMGERGLVVLSDDGGKQWRQARARQQHLPAAQPVDAIVFHSAHQGLTFHVACSFNVRLRRTAIRA